MICRYLTPGRCLLAVLGLVSMAVTGAQGGWSVGVSLGGPHCHRPYYAPYHYHYRPYPIYVGPAPLIVQPVTVVEPAPAVYAVQPAPVVARASASAPATLPAPRDEDAERYLRQLQHPDPRERAEAAVQLGRMRAAGSLNLLTATMTNDRSPQVREAAARGLGLFGSSDALDGLQRAASSDEDMTVRHSASYAADIIRTNLRRSLFNPPR